MKCNEQKSNLHTHTPDKRTTIEKLPENAECIWVSGGGGGGGVIAPRNGGRVRVQHQQHLTMAKLLPLKSMVVVVWCLCAQRNLCRMHAKWINDNWQRSGKLNSMLLWLVFHPHFFFLNSITIWNFLSLSHLNLVWCVAVGEVKWTHFFDEISKYTYLIVQLANETCRLKWYFCVINLQHHWNC